jgi:hypothetical protein
MDLVTKGEDPFAHLIAAQVRLQPPASSATEQTPNAGRKTLLFSDGRQKAARLALDVPRVLALDAFRQTILFAANWLRELELTSNLKKHLYPAFVAATSRFHLTFFDGNDAAELSKDEKRFRADYQSDIVIALDPEEPWDPTPPMQFRVELMKLLGSRHYSLYALGLGYVTPTRKTLAALQRDLGPLGLSKDDAWALAVLWTDNLLSDFSLYSTNTVKKPARVRACGYPLSQVGSKTGYSADQKKFLKHDIPKLAEVEAIFFDKLTSPTGNASDLHVLDEQYLLLVPAASSEWHRCRDCTYLAPVTWRGRCAWCGGASIILVPPGGDDYVQARKAFWRKPVVDVLQGRQSPFTLSVEEHTAQLSFRDTGSVESTTEEYERRFRDILRAGERSIDALSCTTTMEVGIDIGSLIGVGLRNMPPTRHNYQQRAGRAGRRGSAVSTVITFAQHNPHDTHLFDNPNDLISGPPRPAGLDVKNPTIVKRHAFAELIQEYFNSELIRQAKGNIFAMLGKTDRFYTGSAEGTLGHFSHWLTDSGSEETRERLKEWLPQGIGLTPEECARALVSELEELRRIFEAGVPKDEENLIEFLFAHGVLPAYAFRRDLVALEIEEDTAQPETRERPQQAANIALSEYAPGRTVVVNKKKYRVGAVTAATLKNDHDRAAALFSSPAHYLQCAACLNTLDPIEGKEGSTCLVCRLAPLQVISVIQPQVVWPEGGKEVDELDDEQVYTDTTVAQLPIPSSNARFHDDSPFGPHARLRFGRLVPLVVVNRGLVIDGDPKGFDVCKKCGFVPLPGASFPTSHERCYHVRGPSRTRACNGTPQNVYLGYRFETDVSLLHVPLDAPFACDLADPKSSAPLQAAAHSLANALAIVAAAYLEIDERELQCGHRLGTVAGGNAVLDVYVYDTLTGGAGYSRLVGRNFPRIFDATMKRLLACDCATSCTKCLQTYANRMSQSLLDRHLALDLARYVRDGVAPMQADSVRQRAELQPLLGMLKLDGWATERSRDFGAVVTKGNRTLSIGLRPALLHASALQGPEAERLLSDFEVKKDLPSCLIDVNR